jgi:hypothetical protein
MFTAFGRRSFQIQCPLFFGFPKALREPIDRADISILEPVQVHLKRDGRVSNARARVELL